MANNNTETIDSIKKTMLNLKEHPTAVKSVSRFLEQREKLLLFLQKHKKKAIIITSLLTILIIYFVVFYNRINRYLGRMRIYNMQINPLQYNQTVMNGNYKLCDFYISASYKSYLPCTNYYDYASTQSIQKLLQTGVRYIDLDIFNKDFSSCSEPIICAGDEVGNWKYTTSITLDMACETIAKSAFSSNVVSNPGDPLFINLNFKTWYNTSTISKCAGVIKRHFQHKLLSKKFGYQGRYTSKNLATTPIKELIGKVIIITSGKIIDTDMDEICNLNSDTASNLRNLTNVQVKDSYDPNELKEYNKRNLTRVIPAFNGRKKDNFNFYTAYYLGCQFICMNFTEPTDFMLEYAKRFKKCSFILKPYKLRYRPILIKAPLKQTKKVSFAPKKVTTPFYSITY